MNSKAQIIVTIGKSSENPEIFRVMLSAGLDLVRLNFSWGSFQEKKNQIEMVRVESEKLGKKIPIIADLPGPRIQINGEHTYDKTAVVSFTPRDRQCLEFAVSEKIDFVALSFIGSANDVALCREAIKSFGGSQLVIAKIERALAVDSIDEIINAADAVMIARGDLGKEIPLEKLPFIQEKIIRKAKQLGKPVVTATGMLLSMTEHNEPTRAEVADVFEAIVEGSDAVMLSEETASGKYPVESVKMMEKIVLEAEKHLGDKAVINDLSNMKNKEIKMGKLVIVRHHESEWNKLGWWTGSRDSHLTPYGFEKSKEMGELVKDICFDYAFASMQVRSIETLSSMLSICMADGELPTEHVSELNERGYGDYTGKNKWDMEKLIGTEEFDKLRRGWDYPVPNGETLKMVYERAVPFFLERVLSLLKQNKNILIVSHGNTVRALIKYIENIADADMINIEEPIGTILIYDLDGEGHKINKEIRKVESEVNA
ncbi:MAG: hypothetical protein A3H52_01725 [Candidatus Zambryskibacteria bacterium RIFCSPLOWO2_02_FULL_39_26]|uniref:pyruvate kinase n=1 Tax=Candidatus Zambryskibacteria bacterium RIFCSPLOWO2_12_FULL_39_23 TaxID=1802776 RepID=A0A1G2USC6_9BACT|nr:MAG: hypothetical protein A2W51_02750 [Candidatus Zambryskibacteria bacterium RIFCSPHIGHO2_02_39_10]OHB00283.1 MAG: hypothetical protein A3E59_00870 [Candidatus Zambryskibacteria bacterium RIFCSPHIGHO2_12_FULL_39_47]OHB09659.1 MAG: hypothetical protein A3H52_01725 [Candidatus Zambryskibacteria bacterium RIFCSPLOWO2_02_FULL_39_26]OHB12260.1 MAG: hypothetical protein A3G99_00665 [Candidatus Zambryskibacteria bacterium RIFCSPLOWO2_12_FULL_39_23]